MAGSARADRVATGGVLVVNKPIINGVVKHCAIGVAIGFVSGFPGLSAHSEEPSRGYHPRLAMF